MKLAEVSPSEIASLEGLRALEKKRRLSQSKWLMILVAAGALAIIGTGIFAVEIRWLLFVFVVLCIATIFGVGFWLFIKTPVLSEVEHEYSQFILPGLIAKMDVADVKTSRRHDLAMKVILETGLFHSKYSAISREDAVQGKVNGIAFGMYEFAMQTRATYSFGFVPGTDNTVGTNQFYGWLIIVPMDRVPGFHFITMKYRTTGGESDDWHSETLQHWEDDKQLQKITLGVEKFDRAFLLNSDQPGALRNLLTPQTQAFLLYLFETSQNAFAISIQRGRIYLMIGHESATFRKCPPGKFTEEIHPEVLQDAKWYIDLIRGLSRMKAG